MKWLLMIGITSLTLALGLTAGCGAPADTTAGTPSPLEFPAPISSSPTHSAAEDSPPDYRSGLTAPEDTTAGTPSPLEFPAPISSSPTHSAAEDSPVDHRSGLTSQFAASCMSRYWPEMVRDRAFAFDGTVESVETRVDTKLPTEGSQSQELPWVTFKVNQWFKGEESSEVGIWVPPHPQEGVWPLESGDRLLVAGEYRWGQPPEDPLAWGCGFTQLYIPETAEQWADAMPATTAMPLTQTSTLAEKPRLPAFPEPPLADLTIGEQHQTAGQGGYCWSDKSGRPSCRTMIGIPTAQEPLRTNSPFKADFRLRVEKPPSGLRLGIYPVKADDQRETRDRDIRWWRPSGMLGGQLELPPERETTVELSLKPGLYVFEVFGRWPGMGNASYGFLVEVR